MRAFSHLSYLYIYYLDVSRSQVDVNKIAKEENQKLTVNISVYTYILLCSADDFRGPDNPNI